MTSRISGNTLTLSCLALVAATVLSAGCSYKRDKNPDSSGAPETASQGGAARALKAENLSYAALNEQIFVPKCLQCHNSSNPKGGYVLDTYAAVKAHISEIDSHVLIKKDMPRRPVPPLSSAQEEMLTAWIHAGTPEFPIQAVPANPANPGTPGNPTPIDPGSDGDCHNKAPAPEEYRWAALKKGLIEQNCLRCHGSDDAESGLGLATAAAMREHIDDVLSEAVIKRKMPPKHPLTEEQQDLLLKWVRHGMQE